MVKEPETVTSKGKTESEANEYLLYKLSCCTPLIVYSIREATYQDGIWVATARVADWTNH